MKKNRKAISTKLLVITLGIGVLTSCVSDKDSPGWDFMPDMARSPAIEPYVDYGWIKERTNAGLTISQSALIPPRYTIPYHGDIEDLEIYLPYQRGASSFAAKTHNLRAEDGWNLSEDPAGDYALAKDDVNPIRLTLENQDKIFEEGKELYTINCAHCHGKTGDGKGSMVESGAYAGVPDYNILNITDGQMFYSIYHGRNMMGAHASIMTNKEIWEVVHYINKLKDETYGAETIQKTEVADSISDVLLENEQVIIEQVITEDVEIN